MSEIERVHSEVTRLNCVSGSWTTESGSTTVTVRSFEQAQLNVAGIRDFANALNEAKAPQETHIEIVAMGQLTCMQATWVVSGRY